MKLTGENPFRKRPERVPEGRICRASGPSAVPFYAPRRVLRCPQRARLIANILKEENSPSGPVINISVGAA